MRKWPPRTFSPSLTRLSRLELSHTLTPFPLSLKSCLPARSQSPPSRMTQPMRPSNSRWQQAPVGPLGCPSLGTTTATVSSPHMAMPMPLVLIIRWVAENVGAWRSESFGPEIQPLGIALAELKIFQWFSYTSPASL